MTSAPPQPDALPHTPVAPLEESLWQRIDKTDLARTGFVAACAIVAALLATFGAAWWAIAAFAVVALVIGCWPILVEAWEDIRARRMSMELSMLIAVAAAAAIGEWVTALTITAFVLAAEILEDLSLDRGRDALTELMTFLPSVVQVRDGDTVRTVDLAEVTAGQVVVVSPGGRIPVDGIVVEGGSSVDQSRITGEPLPIDVTPGSTVFAGSINQVGALALRAERVGEESSYGQIVASVQAAQTSQAPVQRLADRLAAYLVYIALAAAAVTLIVTRDLHATISVVIVAGACGIAAGTPLAMLASIARAARSGAFVKDGTHIEELSKVDTVVFDKTGTLTVGEPEVVDVRGADAWTDSDVLRLAATAEVYSEHPLGQAIVASAHAAGVDIGHPESFDYEPGRGLSALVDGQMVRVGNASLVPEAADDPAGAAGATVVHIAVGQVFAGSIVLSDTVRDSAAACVQDLHRMGLKTLMITGDAQPAARAVAATLGIDDVRAEVLPAEKQSVIESLRAAGRRVAMVGDGVNDAPALARANVGIAMGTGTEVARETADVVLISSDLGDLTRTIGTARRTRRIVMFNFFGTIAVDAVGMVLAAMGLLGPVFAALVHVGSETAFILNSARLIPGRRRRTDHTS